MTVPFVLPREARWNSTCSAAGLEFRSPVCQVDQVRLRCFFGDVPVTSQLD
jgi:hypothetical protein